MITKIPKVLPIYGSDNCPYIIALLQAIQNGVEIPNEISEETYNTVRDNKDNFDKWFVGFVGYCCSYSGKFFGGYARGENRNYADEQYRKINKTLDLLDRISFYHNNYYDIIFGGRGLIYCDPPYLGSTGYKSKFDHQYFWNWCDQEVDRGNTVYVSEYNAPSNWQCIFEKEQVSSLTQDTGSKSGVERLFIK